MRILASISLFLLGLGLVCAIISYNPTDLSNQDWFLPSPHPVENLLGPLGAWIALRLINLTGYLSIILGLILMLIGVGRFFQWKFSFLTKIFGYIIGWIISISLPTSLLTVEYRESILGSFGKLLVWLLNYTGAVGKYFLAFGIFIIWSLWATKIGFRRPAIIIYNLFASLVGLPKKIAQKRKDKEARERTKLLEEHRRRQESIHRKISSSRTGKLVPGALPEELLVPPSKKENESPQEKSEETLESSPGMTDDSFVPPPITTLEVESKQQEITETRTDERDTPQVEVSKGDEEIIVSPTEKEVEHSSSADSDTMEEEKSGGEIPPWLVIELPEQKEAPEEKPIDIPAALGKQTESETKTETYDEPKVVEPEESPGEEIEPLQEEDEEDIGIRAETSTVEAESEEGKIVLTDVEYNPPPIGLLYPGEKRWVKYSEMELQQMARKLFEALKTYNVDGKITAITPGPIITRFEFQPAPGIKISKIVNLADDLALSLKSSDVRIVAPLPDKGTVGIEVPNREQETVYIRNVLESQAFRQTKANLPLALGKKVAGEPIVADLAKMPHLLIAGATGSGKSVCINAIITSLIYKKDPNSLRLLLVDPKRLELSIYNGIPFLVSPVIVEHKEASAALNWALMEMDRRYHTLAKVRARKMEAYNEMVNKKPELGEPLPYIVIIIDEMADLMMTVSSEIEEPIARLAQMARAVGIHLIIATQRPSVDVITGVIKANFPSRIAFKVRSKIDSRTILDMSGAEKLLGNGDMLYLPSGFADPVRIHGSYVATEETENIVEYLKQFDNPQTTELSFKEVMARKRVELERDELFWEAAKITVMSQKGSASNLQRKLRIGYTRAASIIDQLEASGIVGPFEGSKPREVLIKSLSELDELREELGN